MLSAEGFRASTLFDLLQDCDAVYDENLRAQVMGYNLPKNPAGT
jgi:hypothetical protein